MVLSAGEKKTVQGFIEGLMGPQIAARYGWSENIPQIYIHRVKRKMRATTRIQAIVLCVKKGLV